MPTTYTIRPGDTLGKIAVRFYRSAAKYPLIVNANQIANPDRLKVDQILVIPDVALSTTHIALPVRPPLSINEQRLSTLHPVVAARGRTLVELAAHAGFAVLVTQGLRTWKEQDILYAKGRKVPPVGKKFIVTNAKGGHSWHNFGLAFDIVILDAVGKADWNTKHPGWKKVGTLGKTVGLEWGGDWTSFKDYPHFQYTCGLSLAKCRELSVKGLKGLWTKVQ
jgi:LysM repeat protein